MLEVSAAIYARLVGTSAITTLLGEADAYRDIADVPDADYPVCVFGKQAGGMDNDNPGEQPNLLYLMKAVSLSVMSEAEAIDKQIRLAFHMVPLTVSGWTNMWIARESDVSYAEPLPNGVVAYHSGGLYRIRLS